MSGRRALRETPASFETFVADDDELVTGEAVGLDLRPASFVLRIAGVVIDYLIYFAALVGLIVVIALAGSRGLIDDSTGQALVITALVLSLVVAPTAIETLTLGRSVGKRVI